MSLTKIEFEVLRALMKSGRVSQRSLAADIDASLGSVNAALKSLSQRNLVADGFVTPSGFAALEPYRVNNAIILAAGLSTRFAPISYEKPKGLLNVQGEVLIERQIRQLLEAGISDITLVVGYKKEYYFYLEDKFGVSLVVNSEYATRNNSSSVKAVLDRLGCTYICSSDVYYTSNPFDTYAFEAYYASQFVAGPTKEWCLTTGAGKRIVSVDVGGSDAWIMLGHAYFDERFSRGFSRLLVAEYDDTTMADKLWEDVYVDHIDELRMVLHPYDDGTIYEFDTLDELRAFDPTFLSNVDSAAFDNMVSVLGCEKDAICDVYPLKQGLTNLSCHFSVNGSEYVYRHPGVGTEQLIDRKGEVAAQKVAKELGLDDTFLYEDPATGWKVARFVPRCRSLDPRDPAHLERAMEMARQLHEEQATLERTFDFYIEGKRYERLLKARGPIDVPDYFKLAEKADALSRCTAADDAPVCLSHNDFFTDNFLIDETEKIYLIDWEYAGMSDYASDYGTFVVCCQLTEDEADLALSYYFGRPPSLEERRHNLAYVALAGWCWYVWSLYKEAEGESVGAWLYTYYNYAKTYADKALKLYQSGIEDGKAKA